ncbi:MAG: TetR/AcrR family transcriptional regulator [Clostridia bacterium]|nr:TetR/AcrR family transcriptional regulator [Clostridia bacterium]
MELRDRIISAALEIFGENGYEKATIAQIVERAQSSKGGFYHHFESKKQILDEITKMYLDEVTKGCMKIADDPDKDTVYLLNNIFEAVNNFKKQKLSKWKELMNLYSHKDSEYIRMRMYIEFIEFIAEIYEKLIKRGVEEGIFSLKSPKALARMWANEITQLYGQITNVLINGSDKELYDDFISQALFVEDIINYSLGSDIKMISILKPMKEYLDMAIEVMNETESGE